MSILIKKYKNRRLYDTEKSLYITMEDLTRYVLAGTPFRVEDSQTHQDITNPTLLQILVEMEANTTQFLSTEMLRQLITVAHHPMNQACKEMLEQVLLNWKNLLQTPSYQNYQEQLSNAWQKQIETMTKEWQQFLNPKK